jgi:hypothetical protein
MRSLVVQAPITRFGLLLVVVAPLALGCQRRVEPAPAASTRLAATSAPSAVQLPDAPASAPVATPDPPFEVESVTAVIVWQDDARAVGRVRSQWVELVDKKPKVVSERPGLIAVASTSLWTLGTTTVMGCTQNARDAKGDVVVRNDQIVRERPKMDMPELVRASDGKRVAPWKDGHGYPSFGTSCDSALEDYGVDVKFEGGMGPFVNAGVNHYESYGGAHGVRGHDPVTINLETGDAVKLAAPAKDRVALKAAAAKGLGCEPKNASETGVVLVYGPVGAGLALYSYLASGDYAGSGGTSYSTDFVVSSKNLPVEVDAFRTLPTWAVPYLKGKSLNVFMVPPARAAQMRRDFDAAYAATGKPLP